MSRSNSATSSGSGHPPPAHAHSLKSSTPERALPAARVLEHRTQDVGGQSTVRPGTRKNEPHEIPHKTLYSRRVFRCRGFALGWRDLIQFACQLVSASAATPKEFLATRKASPFCRADHFRVGRWWLREGGRVFGRRRLRPVGRRFSQWLGRCFPQAA
jgi:hypothetical protein